MIDIDKLIEIGAAPKIVQLADFLNKSANGRKFPNYKSLNLMEIPRLVPNIFSFDFSKGADHDFPFHFSGTKIDEQYGFNVSGRIWQDVYKGKHRDIMWRACYRPIITHASTGYNRRTDFYIADDAKKVRFIEAACFPCSTDDESIDFGLGISLFSFPDNATDDLFISI